MSEGRERTCFTCQFYVRGLGQCRAEPPVPVGVATDRGALGVWPTTREDHWCGRHALRSSAPVAEGA